MGCKPNVGPQAGGGVGSNGATVRDQLESKAELDAQLLDAHAGRNPAKIAYHYGLAADQAEDEEDIDQACFFLTHAWIFALEAGDPAADQYRSRLAAFGRV